MTQVPRASNDSRQCVTREEVQDMIEAEREVHTHQLREIVFQLDHHLGSVHHPVQSCRNLPENYLTGYYWIRNSTGHVRQEYCDMNRRCCGSPGGWMRVAHLDMTDSEQQCPDGFKLISSPKRTCTRESVVRGCTSVVYPTQEQRYSRVCGRIKAYQHSHPSAFRSSLSLESPYVDGVSLTHGPVSARKHIWTFAAAYSDDSIRCSCSARSDPRVVPSFVGRDFFCETASRTGWEETTFGEDPLWDGEGCDSQTECCGFNDPPWFCKELPQSTTDDIEMRLCLNAHPDYGNVLIEMVDIFVQ